MYEHLTRIRLKDTDATGVLYFAAQFQLALETFEEYLKGLGLPLADLIYRSDFLIPIVHAEADYTAPLCVGDEIKIVLTLKKMGTSSFTLHYRLFYAGKNKEVGTVTIVHVSMCKESKSSKPIPESLRGLLSKLNED